jgi:hypothetical protein
MPQTKNVEDDVKKIFVARRDGEERRIRDLFFGTSPAHTSSSLTLT